MHAESIVARFVEGTLSGIHGARRRVLAAVVWAAMRGHALSLSRLGRGVAHQRSGLKAGLKRVDRLIGSQRIDSEVDVAAEALLALLCRWLSRLVIAVDWSAAAPGGTFVELRAAVVWLGMGRGITVYQRVYPAAKQGNAKAERALLKALRRWIPRTMRVIVISDAGFRTPWFRAVERLGWEWIGRVRGGNQVRRGAGLWQDVLARARRATGQAQRQTDGELTQSRRCACDLVQVRLPRVGRTVYRRPGHGPSPKAAAEARASAREPWVLAHSTTLRDLRADEIVALYARRMQIEENFRDAKSLPFGMGAEIGRSRSALRLQALLLIATLAAFLLWHLGQLAEAEGLHLRYKVTTRAARELSIITLAMLLCTERSIDLTPQGLRTLHQRLGIRE